MKCSFKYFICVRFARILNSFVQVWKSGRNFGYTFAAPRTQKIEGAQISQTQRNACFHSKPSFFYTWFFGGGSPLLPLRSLPAKPFFLSLCFLFNSIFLSSLPYSGTLCAPDGSWTHRKRGIPASTVRFLAARFFCRHERHSSVKNASLLRTAPSLFLRIDAIA
jgi:hypothetical protein